MAESRTEHQFDPAIAGLAPREAPRHRDLSAEQTKGPVADKEPMTPEQADLLRVLSEKADEPFDPSLDRFEAGHRIHELRRAVGQMHT